MRMNHDRLYHRLLRLEWRVLSAQHDRTYMHHESTGRTGYLPWAARDMNTKPYSTHLWDRTKKELGLVGEEIHGRPR